MDASQQFRTDLTDKQRWLLLLGAAAFGLLGPWAWAWARICRNLIRAAIRHTPPSTDISDLAGGVSLLVLGAGLSFAAAHSVLRIAVAHRHLRQASRDGEAVDVEIGTGVVPVVLVPDLELYAWAGGLVRPRVVVSRAVADLLADDEFRALVAHEWSHVRHRDAARYLLAGAARRALFFLPLARDLEARIRLAAEFRADAETPDQDALGRALLVLSRRAVAPAPAPGAVSTVLPRLERIVRPESAGAYLSLQRDRVIGSLGILGVVAFGAVQFVGAHTGAVTHASGAVCMV